MPIKSVKMKISKNKKMLFFLISQGSLNPKIRFLGQKVWPVARGRTDAKTDRHESENRGHPFIVSGVFPATYHQESAQKSVLGIVWGNATRGTKLPRIFCARIGPLQIGRLVVVLFSHFFQKAENMVNSRKRTDFLYWPIGPLPLKIEFLKFWFAHVAKEKSKLKIGLSWPKWGIDILKMSWTWTFGGIGKHA